VTTSLTVHGCTAELRDAPMPSNGSAGTLLATLDVLQCSVTLDETWAPYAQATVVVTVPGMATIDYCDPRLDTRRLRITMARTFPLGDGVDQSRTFDLQLRSRDVDYQAGTMTLTAASDEGSLQDRAWLNVGDLAHDFGTGSLRTMLGATILRKAYPALTATYPLAGTADGTVQAGTAVLQIGQDYWSLLQALLPLMGLRLWVDEARTWHLDANTATVPGLLALNYLDDLTAARDGIDRASGDWADAVLVHYTWLAMVGGVLTPQSKYYAASAHTATRVRVVELNARPPGTAQGVQAAQRFLQAIQDRARTLTLEAPTDLSASPSMAYAAASSAIAPAQSGIVRAVTFSYPGSRMTLTTRSATGGSVSSWLVQPAGYSWAQVPAGVSWAAFSVSPQAWSNAQAGISWSAIAAGVSWDEYLGQ
jgi:hypothetical protein